MKALMITLGLVMFSQFSQAQEFSSILHIKTPGNPANSYPLSWHKLSETEWQLQAESALAVDIKVTKLADIYRFTIDAKQAINFNLQNYYHTGLNYQESQLLLPGFWYRKNLRSSEGAPSARVSTDWSVREDRLSTPLSGVYHGPSKTAISVLRKDAISRDSLAVPEYGERILNSHSDVGSLGFGEKQGQVYLQFSYPAQELPKTYLRKLTLAPGSISFASLAGGDSQQLNYQLRRTTSASYSDFVASTWRYSYDSFKPKTLTTALPTAQVKTLLAKFYKQSFVDESELSGFSGAHISTAKAERRQLLEVGFLGRVLLNAFNAIEHGDKTGDKELSDIGREVYFSYLNKGFRSPGLLREFVDFDHNKEPNVYSIRRQSEGAYAALLFLNYEKDKGRRHQKWEKKISTLLDLMLGLQQPDGSFPRKFDAKLNLIDASGGSSASAVLPLVMAYRYFSKSEYLTSAKRSADFLEHNIVLKADYFSSTLDAYCEDKEASFYTATAMYYLALVSHGKEKQRYIRLLSQANYFVLSWYYNWDVPFAKGQMLGDVGFKTRGWGNVSVENNHVDVFIFGYLDVLRWLAKEQGEARYSEFAAVIESSMKSQLLPRKGHMFNIGKEGYYPEVVQHTNWDYGHFGKGFYNVDFAPGWTVASLWQMLSPGRAETFLLQ